MKKLILILLLIPSPILSHDYHSSFKHNNKCYGNVYREKYIQGNIQKTGYVRKWEETINIPCDNHQIGINNKNIKNIKKNDYQEIFKDNLKKLSKWINNQNIKRNDYQKIYKDNLKKLSKWINSKIADWKLNQSDNYLNE